MAFLRKTLRDHRRPADRPARTFSTCAAIARWIAVPGAGVALSLWLIAGMAGAYSAGGTLSTASTFMPRVPRDMVASTPRAEKADRMMKVAASAPHGEAHRKISIGERFDTVVARAALSPHKLAAAFARSGMALSRAVEAQPAALPLKERFAVARAEAAHRPLPVRFGKRSEVERSSRLALALAGSTSVELAYAVASASASSSAFNRLFVSPESMDEEDEGGGEVALFEDLPDEIPLPTRRPHFDNGPADKPEKPARRLAKKQDDSSKPAKHRDSSNMLAFAKPDDPREGGGLFSGLFSHSPRPRKGVAIYDISAATVTMPDGTRLEAHSGIGHMADNIKYVDRKMRGPTPPGTYKLTMREALFHGVEAIRLTPVDGKNPYGRNGLLAHTEMLRGRPEQSNGCVAFKDYKRFLAAFKRGKVKRMIVVPGKSRYSLPPTTVADNGRGA